MISFATRTAKRLQRPTNNSLREKCPNTELFLVRISCIRTEYGVVNSGAQGHGIERVVR